MPLRFRAPAEGDQQTPDLSKRAHLRFFVLAFPNNLYAAAFAAAFMVSWLTLPMWRSWAQRTGLVDDPGLRKIHTTPIPLAGGFAVFSGLLIPVLTGFAAVCMQWIPAGSLSPLTLGLQRRSIQLAAILCGALGMLALGWIDDRHELSARHKFVGQCLIATLVASSGLRITLFVPSLLFSYAITILWILTLTNAFNFMDNMNGLCAGLAAISALSFASAAASRGQYLVTVIALLACGSLVGFLPHNFPRATAFLGDAGSHLSGFLMSILAILPHFYSSKNPDIWAVLQPLFILAVPLLDLVSVVVIRWRAGKPVYLGDNNHFSHRLTRCGFSKTSAVLWLWLLASAISALGLAL